MRLISLWVITTKALYIHMCAFINVSKGLVVSRGPTVIRVSSLWIVVVSEDLKIPRCAFCFNGRKMQNLFFFGQMFGICCYLKRVFHMMVKPRYFGSQALVARGYRLRGVVSSNKWGELVSQGRGSPFIFQAEIAAQRGPQLPPGTIEVVTSVCINFPVSFLAEKKCDNSFDDNKIS